MEEKCEKIGKDNVCLQELPRITWRNKKFTFDYRLRELREIKGKKIDFINLTNQEAELLNFALEKRNIKLINTNMNELSWKLGKRL